MISSESLPRPDGQTVASQSLSGGFPGIAFLAGLRSDMTGAKTLYLDQYCRNRGLAYVRFDYFGHDRSSGEFALGTVGRWAGDAIAVLDELTRGLQILFRSSIGGWIMLR
jgi:pimeloyl-ACP methyl ester carboxylesterase